MTGKVSDDARRRRHSSRKDGRGILEKPARLARELIETGEHAAVGQAQDAPARHAASRSPDR